MTKRVTSRRRGSYGIDAPFAPTFMVILLIVEIVLGIISSSVKPFARLFVATFLIELSQISRLQ